MKYTIICILSANCLLFGLSQIVSAQHPAQTSDTFECDYTTDIDQDDDGLIEICDLEGLNAIRHQLDGSGYKASADADVITTGCKADGCNGYELTRDLDFNDDASYSSTANKDRWTTGFGWQPIGDAVNFFAGIFEGNGYTISNLRINRPGFRNIGLFAHKGGGSEISNVGLLNVKINGQTHVGGLVGLHNSGSIANSYTGGSVEGLAAVGGLVGSNSGTIANSYATVGVRATSDEAGGLVGGHSRGSITDSYATGSVEGSDAIGGLVGMISDNFNSGTIIENSYAVGSVTGVSNVGGLVGLKNLGRGTIVNSYWDTERSGILTSAGGTSATTAQLQMPTEAGSATTDAYYNWSTDNWDFGASGQLPILKYKDVCMPTTAGQPICDAFLPHQGIGLRTLEVSTGSIVRLLPVFSSERGEYVVDIPSSTDSIDLRLQSYDFGATFEIKKQGDNTNYFADTERSTIAVSRDDIVTIRVTEAAADTAATTITSYTLWIGISVITLSAISVAEDPPDNIDDTDNTDDTVNEGSVVALRAIVGGGSRDYTYRWTQTLGKALVTTGTTTAALRFEIPDNFVGFADTTDSVEFTVTATDSIGNTITGSKTLTIVKQDNGTLVAEIQGRYDVSGTMLIAVVTADDPDGGQDTDKLTYQWQEQVENSVVWTNIGGANTKTYVTPKNLVDLDYRVRIAYTDGQDHASRLETEEFSHKSFCDGTTDIDQDDDGLIEICNLEGLNAIRYQLDGTGYKASADADKITTGCKAGGCNGYELTRDLDFGDDASYGSTADTGGWTTGVGWQPIGDAVNFFAGIFEGNGYTISNLTINRLGLSNVGLFGHKGGSSKISNVGLLNVKINGQTHVGGLVGLHNGGSIANSYTDGSVEGSSAVGGLVGDNSGDIANSYAAGTVTATSDEAGSLVGVHSRGTITDSYTTGSVEGSSSIGGLVGVISDTSNSGTTIKNSYAAGSVTGVSNVGGLVGLKNAGRGTIANSYWDTEASGILTSAGGTSATTAQLQMPTEAGSATTEAYYNWSTDNWDFGTSGQLPILKYKDVCTAITAGQPICDAFLPHQGSGLRTLKVSADNVVPLTPVFSSEQSEYIADTPPNTESIDLQLKSYDAYATFEIKKQGDNTNYFVAAEGSDIPVSRDDIVTIRVTEAAADTAATTITSYTLQIGFHPITISAISVAEDPADNIDDADNTDDTVNEGSVVSLSAIVGGGSGDYTYRWTQTSGRRLAVIGSSTATTLTLEIPEDFVLSAATTDGVVFTMTVTDAKSNNVPMGSVSRALTIVKQNNGNISTEFEEETNMDGTMLTVVVTQDDPDGNPDTIDYQWQKQTRGSMQWMDISGADTNIYEVLPTTISISYRVVVKYTDGQGYKTELEEIGEFFYKALCDYATDVDLDDNGLIEICDSDGLNAIRYQPDGSGYKASAAADIITTGCPDGGCKGYELTGDLDLAKVDNWLPINAFAGIFEGNGFTISNLKINRPNTFEVGLFGTTVNNAKINNVGLLNVDIKGSTNVGGLVGESSGSIAGSYVSGHINGDTDVGGLVGENRNRITDSYAIGSVDGSSSVGGLVGHNDNNIVRSYAGGRVKGYTDVGGLVGNNSANITNSYASGSVDGETRVGGLIGAISIGITKNNYATGFVVGETNVGGLVGNNFGNVANSYWDTETSGILTSSGGIPKATVELQTPTSPTGIYSMWSTDDWDFGSASQYPVLKDANGDLLLPALRYGLSRLRLTEGNLSPDFVAVLPNYAGTVVNDTNTIQLIPTAINSAARIRIKSGEIDEQIASGGMSSKITLNTEDTTTITIVVINTVATIEYNLSINYYSFSRDIDRDDDGLIEIDDVAGLNAIRYQADGTGYRRTSTDPKVTTGCPENLCIGYELTGDLDLAKVDNWLPINAFEGIFEGNGYTISNLKIDRPDATEVGLFGYIRVGSEINNVGLLNANVKGSNNVGSLVGENNHGTITNSYATGFVDGDTSAGGLVGDNSGDIANSYAAVSVAGGFFIGGLVGNNSGDIVSSYAIGTVAGNSDIGGLVGQNNDVGIIANSYATGAVDGTTSVGGLVGNNSGDIANSYAIGFVDGDADVGGLVGSNSGDIANSYWDKEATKRATSDGGIGETTAGLQTPTTTTGIYSEWSTDNWDFGSASQYPVLKDENGNLLSPALRYGLSRLRLTEGDLSPDFAGPVLNYVGTVVGLTNMTRLIPTAVNSAARIRIKSGEIDDEIASGAMSSEITLNTENITTITIVVTDSGVTTEYNLYISYFRPAIEDIDEDGDGLIEIDDVAGLDAIRYQPDGTGYRRTSIGLKVATGCPDDGCKGYELTGNLDLAKEDNWSPIDNFAGIFEGNGHTISNLKIDRPDANHVGLFAITIAGSEIRNIGLLNVDIVGNIFVGGLVALNRGRVANSYAFGTVTGNVDVGGLVAVNAGSIANSYAIGTVTGNFNVGGLVGQNAGSIENSYAIGTVTANITNAGGLVAMNNGRVANSYATVAVAGNLGSGLVAANGGSIANSYWDTDTGAILTGAAGTPKTTAELQMPTEAGSTTTEIYYDWNTDDWDFGTSAQLPILKYSDACTTTTPKAAADQPICDAFLPYQGSGLRTLEILTSGAAVRLLPVFSSEQSEYIADTPPNTSSIDLRLQSYDAAAVFEINKQGDDTDYFSTTEKSTISVGNDDVVTIRVSGAAADTAATTLTSYTLRIGFPPITLEAISVTEDGVADTDDMVAEGSDVTLSTIAAGGSGGYRYEWTQTSGKKLDATGTTATALSIKIPDDFVLPAAATMTSVTFRAMVTDAGSNNVAMVSVSKTLTIVKADNNDLAAELEEESDMDGTTLTAIVTTNDPDGQPDTINYQWQEQVDGSGNWMDIDGATDKTYTVPQTTVNVNYRVRIAYTDNQGYNTTITTVPYRHEALAWEILVTADGAEVAGGEADEGNEVILTATNGSDETYSYQWEQTAGKTLSIASSMTDAALRFETPPDFVGTAATTDSVTFAVMVTDSRNNTITETKTVTIVKTNNGNLVAELEEESDMDGTTLTAIVTTNDPDGQPDTINYQWQEQVEGSGNWMDIDGATDKTYTVPQTTVNVNYRVRIAYTDNQGYDTTIITVPYRHEALAWEISVTADGAEVAGGEADEGNEVTLEATNGSDETYSYQWEQTAGKTLSITGSMTNAALRFEIPPDFIGTAATTDSVTFAVMATDSRNNTITETKTVTIVKTNNGNLVAELEEESDMDGTTLTAIVTTNDPDGQPDTINYQWQEQVEDSGNWINIGSATKTKTYTVMPRTVDVDYRVRITYKDNQDYATIVETEAYQYEALKLEISVTEIAEDSTEDNDDTVREGSRFTLFAGAGGGSGNYSYQWTQTPSGLFPIPTASDNMFGFNIPYTFIQSATSDTMSVTYEVTISDNDSDNYLPVTESKTLTIEKVDNGDPMITAEEDGRILSVREITDADDYDDDTDNNAITYQWQSLNSGLWENINGANAATYEIPPTTSLSVSHRVIVTYTDDQGYKRESIEVYAGLRTHIQVKVLLEGMLQ